MVLTFEQIKELIQEVAERRLEGLEVERSGFRLKIDGHKAAPQAAASQSAPPHAAPAQGGGAPAAGAHQEPSPVPQEGGGGGAQGRSREIPGDQGGDGAEEHPEGSHVTTSPIVGTFYRRPSPDADPFVEVGDRVQEGQVLCIVEAMKLMNEIEADVAGEILEIVPDDAQPVEYGEALFVIGPS